MTGWSAAGEQVAADVIALLTQRGDTVATAESLTGGLVAATLTSIPGSSAVVRGGVVAYASDVKASVLGVDRDLLASGGAVQARVAHELATGVRELMGATFGVATTGVAGPEPSDGKPVGTVFVAVSSPTAVQVQELALAGSRAQIRAQVVEVALQLLLSVARA